MARIELPIEGMTCQHCVRTVTQALTGVPGVQSAAVTLDPQRAIVETAGGPLARETLAAAVTQAGYRVPGIMPAAPRSQLVTAIAPSSSRLQPALAPTPHAPPPPAAAAPVDNHDAELLLDVDGMTCASCVSRVEQALERVPGVEHARANLATNQASVVYDPARAQLSQLTEAVRRAGYQVAPAADAVGGDTSVSDRAAHELAYWQRRLIVGVALLAPLLILHFVHVESAAVGWVQLACATGLQAYVGWPFYVGAVRRARHLSTNMDTLVAIGTLAAFFSGVYGLLAADSHAAHPSMVLMDAGMILVFITLGKFLEARAKGRASAAIRKLLELAPAGANVDRGGQIAVVPAEQVAVGETIVVRPGDKVPLDARVTSGTSSVDQSWLTGESLPVDRGPGDEILAGTINGTGSLTAEVTRPAGKTALAQMVELVRRAQESKTEIQRLADQVVSWFVPAILVIAAVTLVAWGVLGGDWSMGLSCAVAVLVVACPCALGLATPTAILVASGRGAEAGILVKEAHALELAGKLTTIVLDKTGTITLGKPDVVGIWPAEGVTEDELIAVAAGAEQLSQHPLAEPIVALATARGLAQVAASALAVVPGQGIRAVSARGEVLVGNQKLLESHGVKAQVGGAQLDALVSAGQAPLLVASDGKYLGLIAVSDPVGPHSREAIERLKALKLKVLLLTGDRLGIAQRVASEVGIDQVQAEVLPGEKQQVIARLRAQGEVVAMVGDGINDAAALAAADVGIAIGSGADIAIESADIVITTSDLRAVGRAVVLARRTRRTIVQNLAWAFVYNLLLVPVAAGVLVPFGGFRLPAIAAAAAMALSSVSVVTNSLLLRARSID